MEAPRAFEADRGRGMFALNTCLHVGYVVFKTLGTDEDVLTLETGFAL